jgi:hypothetical protein
MTDVEVSAKLNQLDADIKKYFEDRIKNEIDRTQIEFEKTVNDVIDKYLKRYLAIGGTVLLLFGIGSWLAVPGKIAEIAQKAVSDQVKSQVDKTYLDTIKKEVGDRVKNIQDNEVNSIAFLNQIRTRAAEAQSDKFTKEVANYLKQDSLFQRLVKGKNGEQGQQGAKGDNGLTKSISGWCPVLD